MRNSDAGTPSRDGETASTSFSRLVTFAVPLQSRCTSLARPMPLQKDTAQCSADSRPLATTNGAPVPITCCNFRESLPLH